MAILSVPVLEPATETALYRPIKRFLEAQGFVVKGEIGGCDIVALKEGEPPLLVVTELKLAFTLELVLQGIDRTASCDEVWLAVRASPTGRGRERDGRVLKLCRMLGFGLLLVSPAGRVDPLVEPSAWKPRANAKRRARLVREHRRRIGDPTEGGTAMRAPIMTAYRQRALVCAGVLALAPAAPKDLRPQVPDAAAILQTNAYGWFERIARGVYALTDAGRAALVRWPQTSGE
ncbi:MAG TPA: DUF2161 family putative PD-(D/E)XK-type phosphodiesterase [Aliidongia sp.]|uniref:DUF2161 domain-containing phosphodiesterase n=1 Tax=Aliidongia sp. TaxID=1914230 RepID=UPI002DDD4488|nr:DUF2161 family putative PD-(D/E)XK-type phosphodiesterase [Aliidongia sp.]HEV2678732.1 DUF2161 family putative PD-(D/E)XK-type phosphodiesterase [Aliidongia sp.]